MKELDRRKLLFAVAALALGIAHESARADDGDSGGGDSGSGGGSENSGGGSDESGGGSNNSGGGGSDDDDDGDDDNANNRSSGKNRDSDQEKALKAYQSGKIASLRKLKAHLRANFPGSVIKIDLKRRSGRYEYRVKLLEKNNRVKSLTLDGLTLQLRKR